MEVTDYKSFLSSRGVTKISELEKEDLLAFAKTYMDDISAREVRGLIDEVTGITPDWDEVASWIEKAFLSNKKFVSAPIYAESFDPELLTSGSRLEYRLI